MNTSELACPGCEAARNEVKALRFMPGCGSRLSLRSAGTTIVWSERRTNLRLHEIPAGVISLFPVVIYKEVCNSHVPAALSAQDLACALQRPSHRTGRGLSGRCFAVVSNPRVLVRLLPCQANRGGGIQRGSSCDRLLPFDWHPRILVMGVAPLAASDRGHFKSIARQEDCAGGTLRPGRESGSIVAAEAKSYDSRVT